MSAMQELLKSFRGPSDDVEVDGEIRAVYEQLFARCPPLQLTPPWDFITPDEDCRGVISDPDATLAALQGEFADDVLVGAGVLRRVGEDGLEWNPSLSDPLGAIIALRADEVARPYELLTAGGCLSGRELAVFAARRDARTARALDVYGNLFATQDIREAVLLRALNFPTMLSAGLADLGLAELRMLASDYDGAEEPATKCQQLAASSLPDKTKEGAGTHADEHETEGVSASQNRASNETPTTVVNMNADADAHATPGATPSQNEAATRKGVIPSDDKRQDRNTSETDDDRARAPEKVRLKLLGWHLWTLSREVPPYLTTLAIELDAAKRHLELGFRMIGAWRPEPEQVERLAYALRFRNSALVEKMLVDSFEDDFASRSDLERYRDPIRLDAKPWTPANCVEAHSDLLAKLTQGRHGPDWPHSVVNAMRTYDHLVERDLITPLRNWGLAQEDPVIRLAANKLADVDAMLQRISPRIHALQIRQLENLTADDGLILCDLLGRYLKLCNQATLLVKNLKQRRDSQ